MLTAADLTVGLVFFAKMEDLVVAKRRLVVLVAQDLPVQEVVAQHDQLCALRNLTCG